MFTISSNRIAEFRNRLGISQRVLADLIGVSKNTICNIERGLSYPSLTHAIDLCFIFKCSLSDLFSFNKFSTVTLDHYIIFCHEHFIPTCFDNLPLDK